MAFKKIIYNIKKYRFEFRHLTILFLVLIFFQIILSFIQKESLQKFLENTKVVSTRLSRENCKSYNYFFRVIIREHKY